MKNKSVYLAGPITGHSYSEATDWRKEFKEFFEDNGIEAYSPMRGKAFLMDHKQMPDAFEGEYLSNMKTVTMRDRDDATKCGLVLFNFKGAKKGSLGSAIEVGWADAHNVPMIAIMEQGNPHWHGMIREMALVVPDEETAKALALQILLP